MVRRLSIACLCSLSLLAACGDASSLDPQRAAAAKYEQALTSARKVLAEVAVADAAANRASADSLRSTAASCRAPSDSLPGQKAAFALTSAQLLREAARLDAVAIEQVQARQRAAADQLVSALQSARSLKQLQGAMPSADDEQARTLRKAIDDASAAAAELETNARAAMTEVEAKQAAAESASREAIELDAEAAGKRNQAAAATNSAQAQALTEACARVVAQAIDARQAAARAEAIVRTARPDAEAMQRRAEAFRAQQARLQSDLEALEAAGASRSKANRSLAEASGAAMEKARLAADALEKASAELKGLFTTAAESLEQAASLSQQGSSLPGPQGSSAKMSAASTHLAQAMLHERWAGGAAMEAAALDAMAAASGDSKWSRLAASARDDRTSASAKALAALEAADNDIASDQASTLASLKARITEARKLLEGPKPAEATATPESPASSTGDQPSDSGSTQAEAPTGSAPTGDPSAAPPAEPAPEA
jgi:hypothetical protein